MQYYYAINRASRRCTFRPCSLHAPRINTSHSTSQFTTSHFRTSQFTHALVDARNSLAWRMVPRTQNTFAQYISTTYPTTGTYSCTHASCPALCLAHLSFASLNCVAEGSEVNSKMQVFLSLNRFTAVMLVLVLVLKDSLRTKIQSLSWSLSLTMQSLSLSLSILLLKSLSLSLSLLLKSLSLSWSLNKSPWSCPCDSFI